MNCYSACNSKCNIRGKWNQRLWNGHSYQSSCNQQVIKSGHPANNGCTSYISWDHQPPPNIVTSNLDGQQYMLDSAVHVFRCVCLAGAWQRGVVFEGWLLAGPSLNLPYMRPSPLASRWMPTVLEISGLAAFCRVLLSSLWIIIPLADHRATEATTESCVSPRRRESLSSGSYT